MVPWNLCFKGLISHTTQLIQKCLTNLVKIVMQWSLPSIYSFSLLLFAVIFPVSCWVLRLTFWSSQEWWGWEFVRGITVRCQHLRMLTESVMFLSPQACALFWVLFIHFPVTARFLLSSCQLRLPSLASPGHTKGCVLPGSDRQKVSPPPH